MTLLWSDSSNPHVPGLLEQRYGGAGLLNLHLVTAVLMEGNKRNHIESVRVLNHPSLAC